MSKKKEPVKVDEIPYSNQVKRVFADYCCSSWCVKIEDVFGDTFRIGRFDDYGDQAKKQAIAFAKKMNTILKEAK